MSLESVRVKEESCASESPERGCVYAVKRELESEPEEEWLCGVSSAAARAGLYAGHAVKRKTAPLPDSACSVRDIDTHEGEVSRESSEDRTALSDPSSPHQDHVVKGEQDPESKWTKVETEEVKEEKECVSEEALWAELYAGHTVKQELVLGPELIQAPAVDTPRGLLKLDLVANIIGDGNISDFDESDLEERVRYNTQNGDESTSSEDSDVSDLEPDSGAPILPHRVLSTTYTWGNIIEEPRRSHSAEDQIGRTNECSGEPLQNSPRSTPMSSCNRIRNNRSFRRGQARTPSVQNRGSLQNNNDCMPHANCSQSVTSSSRSRSPSTVRAASGGRSTRARSTSTRGRSQSANTLSQRARKWRLMAYDNKDHSWYPSMPTSGVLRTPVDYFTDYFNDEYFKNCAKCTNLYCMRKTGKELKTTPAEIKKFFGVLLVMGCISYPRIHMYWRHDTRLELIANVMTRDRFFLLLNNVHVVPSDTAPPGNTNPLWKVQPAINAVRNGCQKLERVPSFYSIDEQMIPFTGRCGIHVVIRNKPRPVGLKNYVVTTSEGLMVNFEIYYPKNKVFDRTLGEGPGVILFLAQSVPRGSCLYFDRYFNTVPLLDKLSKMGLHGTGTIMANRIPNNKTLNLASKKRMKRGDIEQFVSGDVALVKWMDNKVVLTASNCTGGDNVRYIPRWDRKRKEYVPVKAPQTIMNYNKFKGGVDILDQTIEYYRTFQRTRKWTVKILIHLLDLAAANAWRLYKMDHREQGTPGPAKDLLWFRMDIADSLLHCADMERLISGPGRNDNAEFYPVQSSGRYRPPVQPSQGRRYDGYDHLPMFDDNIQTPRSCRFENCNSRTTILCTKCNVYLCLSRSNNCFYSYHKK